MLRSRSVPGFGTVHVQAVNRHPALVWVATAGLIAATLLGTLGMPPVDVHLPTHHLGIMGPLCGMTRSVARAATGDMVGSWRYHPGGIILVAGAWACIGRAALGRLTGRWFNLHLTVTRHGWWAIGLALAALTVNQQLRADLLA